MSLLGHSGTIFTRRLQQASLPWPVCWCWGHVPAALPSGLWGGQGVPVQLPAVLCCHRAGRYRAGCAGPLHTAHVGASAPPSCHCALSLQDPVSWSTMDKPGMSTASYAAAASSPSGHGPSSQTRRIITVCPVTRASLLLAALGAKRYV